MSHLLRGRTVTRDLGAPSEVGKPPTPPAPVLVTEQQVLLGSAAAMGATASHDRPHRLAATISGALSHIPHSLPEPHQHYPPLHPSYLESARLSREMEHL